MLAIHYCRQDERTRRHTTQRSDIAIGRDGGNDLVLDDPTVSPRHCRVTELSKQWLIEDLGSERGTRINGLRISSAVPVRPGDRIYIGAFVVELEQLDERIGPVEEGLLDAIERGDDQSRAVYADWLEERGDLARAEFVRLQQAIIEQPMSTPAQKALFVKRTKRLRELAESVDIAWRMRVARPAVEGCKVAFEIPCKMDWGALEPTERPEVRTCHTCRKSVHYCASEREALQLASRGDCIVVDIRQLDVACRRCGWANAWRYRFCLGCGAPLGAPREEAAPQRAVMGAMPYIPAEYQARGRIAVAPRATPPAQSVCTACRAPNLAQHAFCQTCGARLAPRT